MRVTPAAATMQLTTVEANTAVMHPDPTPTTTPHSRNRCHGELLKRTFSAAFWAQRLPSSTTSAPRSRVACRAAGLCGVFAEEAVGEAADFGAHGVGLDDLERERE